MQSELLYEALGKMEYIVKLIEALAWPLTILFLAFGFRNQISKAFLRLTSFKYKEFEARFGEDLKEIEPHAQGVITDKSKIEAVSSLRLPSAELSLWDHFINIAEISPRAAITEAWRHLEMSAKGAARTAGLNMSSRFPEREVVKELIKEKIFSQESLSVFEKLRKLRNEVVHAPEFTLDQNQIEKYIELSLSLAEDLYDAGNALGLVRGKLTLSDKNV